jgi:DNA-binding transcriptional regulator YbjK
MSAPRGSARRQAMLDAALALVARGGPRAVTHRAVAAEAGVPLAATTYYFDSRDDLIAQALELCAERDIARVEQHGLHALLPGDPAADAASLLATYELWLEAARNDALRPVARRVSESYVAAARRLVDDDAAARALSGAIEGLVLEVLVGGMTPAEAREAFDRVLEALRLTAGRRRR